MDAWEFQDMTYSPEEFSDLPYITGAGIAPKHSIADVKYVWGLDSDVFEGLPCISSPGLAPAYDGSRVKSVWKFDPEVFEGVPYIAPLEGYTWTEPITDRTEQDVMEAREYIKNMRGNPGVYEHMKGFLNYYDLNRIEKNMRYLASKLGCSVNTVTSWEAKNVPKVSDFQRIMENASTVVRAARDSYEDETFPSPPLLLSDFSDFNNLESMQLYIYEVINA